MSQISIRPGAGKYGSIGAVIEVDGQDVANQVLSATLRLRPDAMPSLEMEFLGLVDVTEIGGEAEWLAYAAGATAHGHDIPTVLRELADKVEAAAGVPA